VPDFDSDTYDRLIDELSTFGPDLTNGYTTHAPMVVEALCNLGRGTAADQWVAANRDTFLPWPTGIAALTADDIPTALGAQERTVDWRAYFFDELQNRPPADVLDEWVRRLAPGAAAAALHGLIRTGHAARAVGHADTPGRRAELAAALASWAGAYRELPTAEGPSAGLSPADALARVGFLGPDHRRNSGSIVAGMAALAHDPDFARVITYLDDRMPVDVLIDQLICLFARVFTSNVRTPGEVVVFTHSVTCFAAVHNLLPFVSQATARRVLNYAWQAAAGLYAAYGHARPTDGLNSAPAWSFDDLADLAAAHGDDHVIKLTEACLTHAADDTAGVLYAAAKQGADIMPR